MTVTDVVVLEKVRKALADTLSEQEIDRLLDTMHGIAKSQDVHCGLPSYDPGRASLRLAVRAWLQGK